MIYFRLGLGAVILLSGCPVWAAKLTVGQSTVAGTNVTTEVPVTLAPGSGDDIAAVQFDLQFDSGAMTLTAVAAGNAAVAAGKDVSFSLPGDGVARIVIAGFNQNVISAGTLASVSVTTSSTIGLGSHPLALAEVVLSDAQGASVSVTGVSGAINAGGAAPAVVGLELDDAEKLLVSAGLVVGTVTSAHSNTVAEGVVISQSPNANAHVAFGGAVNMVVSTGPKLATVPNVAGMTQTSAQNALAAVGLLLGGVTTEYSDTVASGLVIRQTPSSGSRVTSGSWVDVVVSKGPQTTTVPDVAGMTQARAQAAFETAGLLLGTVGAGYSDTVAAGCVVFQTPASGTVVSTGSAVDIVLSMGPQAPVVPNVVGLTRTGAEREIEAVGLVLGTVAEENSDTVATGLVIRQTPLSGTSVSSGSTINLVLSVGPLTTSVPDVVGLTRTGAQTALETAGLVLGTVDEAFSDTVAAGLVISQTPASGGRVAPESAVSLVVSKGVQTVSVPNVAGMTQAQAQAAIAAVGLALGAVVLQYSDTVAAGVVLGQSPAAGLAEPLRAAVDLTVSNGPSPPSVSTVSVPTLVGMDAEDAEAALEADGFVLGTVSLEYSDTVEEGFVIRQNPSAASTAAKGTQISLIVSAGVAPDGCACTTGKSFDLGSTGTASGVFGAALALLWVLRSPKSGA